MDFYGTSSKPLTAVTRWVFSGVVAAVLLTLIELFGLFSGLNWYTYDLYFRFRGDREASERIVIVAIDDKTLQRLGRWPVGRKVYADLLDRLGNPVAVGLAIILADPSPEDADLAEGLSRHPKVVLPTYLDSQRGWIRPNEALDLGPCGHIHLEQGLDGVVREVFHTIGQHGVRMPSFTKALQALTSVMEAVSWLPAPPLYGAEGPRQIIQSLPMWINYYGDQEAFRTVSLVDVLDGRWSTAFFENRIVLVGRTAAGFDDGVLTPLSRDRKRLSAVEVHAHILNNLMDGSDIKPVRSWPLWLSMLFTGLFAFWWMGRQDPLQMVFSCLGAILLVNIVSFCLLVLWYRWLPPAGFCALMVAGCVAGYVARMQQMQALVVQAKQDWEESFDSLDEAVIIYDRDCRIARLNRAASRDLDPGFVAVLRDRCVFRNRGNGPEPGDLSKPPTCDGSFDGAEELYLTHEGRHYEVRSLARMDKQGGFHGLIHVVRDVTYRKQLEIEQHELQARLSQAQKMEALGTLAGGIAHDFNNILSAIIGYAELIAVSTEGTNKIRERLDRIIQAGARAKDLVNRILMFSRQTSQELKPIQPGLIVEEAMRLLRPALPTTIEIQRYIGSKAFVQGDATQVHQIVMNLCTNAYQAMRVLGGVLRVEVEDVALGEQLERDGWSLSPGSYVVIRVIDTGGGIPEEIQKRVFEPYFTTKEKGEGTGLGLSTVHGILKAHHGGLFLESQLGKGSTFHVYLPTIDNGKPILEEAPSPCSMRGNERILFVDDEVALVELAREALEDLGYQVTVSNNPQEALALFRAESGRFDLLITDMTMPMMTGVQLAHHVRSARPDFPIILCTGYRHLVEVDEFNKTGIGSVLTKPATAGELSRAIRRLMDQVSPG